MLSCFISTVCVFQMVILDVLIIGGGPHALTLASLLSNRNPGHDSTLSPPCLDLVGRQPNPETSNKKCCKGKKKMRATNGTIMTLLNKL